ncbi:MAG: efflux RND transporter periplasmic adaptor subunit [Anaerolineales bacterium]|nr:MAG: efflux RND transporter periplasmic adaptor subunit [Anaerolineales bacterium]
MKRWWIIAAVVVIAVLGFFAFRAFRQAGVKQALTDLQTEIVRMGPLTATVGATGVVRANQSVILAFQTNGTVEAVNVAQGDSVRADQVLATLERRSVSSQIIMAEADLASAQRALEDLLESRQAQAGAQLALAQAEDALHDVNYTLTVRQSGNRASGDTIDAAEANLTLANQEVDRAQQLYNHASGEAGKALALSNLIAARQRRDSIQRNINWYFGSPTDIEQAILEADVALAEARLSDAQREWERVKDGPSPADIKAAEARITAAEATLELARITAPFAGTVTSVDVMPGDQATPGLPAFRIDDLSRLLVDVEISEVDINSITLDQPVSLVFDAILDKEYMGVVIGIDQVGVSIQGVVSFPITVEILEFDSDIRSGMTAAVNIIVEQLEDVILIPNRSVRVVDGKRVVYLMEAGVPTPVTVVLGAASDQLYSEVVEGDIKPGDEILLNPPSFVFDSAGGPPSFMQGGFR